VILLFKDDSIEAGTEDFNGRLVELVGEDIRVQAAFILNEYRTPPQFPGDDDLRGLEKDPIPFTCCR
jgi:hypothetical protein